MLFAGFTLKEIAMAVSLVQIGNGTLVPEICCDVVINAGNNFVTNPQLLDEIMKKCENDNYQWSNATTTFCRNNGFLNATGTTLDPGVKKVLDCSVKRIVGNSGQKLLHLQSPYNASFWLVDIPYNSGS
jgi:hypothetical protein